MKVLVVKNKNSIYHVSEKTYDDWEKKRLVFHSREGKSLKPKVQGRTGDGFNVSFS
jgi:hypothetical protein